MRQAAHRNRLVMMVKAPVMGRVKTRLATEIGASKAVAAYRTMMASQLRSLAGDTRWETWIAVTPDREIAGPFWPPHLPRVAQGTGDLGQRMQRMFDCLPSGPVVIVGSDIPAITRADVAAAFRALGSHDAVIGPAADGGYWLIGAARRRHIICPFEGVRWSGPNACADTLANLSSSKVALLREHEDVDDVAGYRRWRS